MAIEVNLTLCLPRDTQTVPLVRHLIGSTLQELSVTADCRSDIELAVTEACANVLDHSQVEDEYEVRVGITTHQCAIRVVDTGRGFDFSTLDPESDPTSERGRGVLLMRALVDRIRFESVPEDGTVVHLVKDLVFEPGAPTFAG